MRFVPRRRHIVAAFSLVALSLQAPQSTAADGHLAASSAIHIFNFGRVSDTYYRGGQPREHDYVDLAALGVKTVIDLTEGDDPNEGTHVLQAGMDFYRIPLTTHTRPSGTAIGQFLAIVDAKKHQPVFVHCQGGHHRTGIMTAVYRIAEEGWTADRAYGEMQKYGFGPAFLHATLKDFVFEYYAAHSGRLFTQDSVTTR